MKRLLSYTFLMMLASAFLTSCIFEKFDDVVEPIPTTLTLQLSMPTKAPINGHTTDGGIDNGNEYENTIPSAKDIRIFLFDSQNGDFLGEATNLALQFNNEQYKYVKGELPDGVVSRNVRMVFMANYEYRMTLQAPSPEQNFTTWINSLVFDFSTVDNISLQTQPKDLSYIPMSGIVDFTVKKTNLVSVEVTRALAKVRICLQDYSGYGIEDINVRNSAGSSYCFQQYLDAEGELDATVIPGTNPDAENIAVPKKVKGSDRTFNITLDKSNNALEFYVAEQVVKEKMFIEFTLFDLANKENQDLTEKVKIEFKDYNNNIPHDIKRNWIYIYNIGKKTVDDTMVDITTSIQKWDVIDLNTDFI